MQMAHRVALDGEWLDEIDDRIIINRIETGDGRLNISAVSLAEDGSRVTAASRDSLDIAVKFCLKPKKRLMAEREELLEKINAWAFRGGWLTTNYKENRKIRVFMAQGATAGDPWDWTKEYMILFRACGVPYWQQDGPATVKQLATSGGSLTIGVEGSAKTVIEVAFKNTSGASVSTFSIDTGESAMAFTALALANGETLIIDHEDTGKKNILRIAIEGTGGARRSVMDKRTGDDDLYITPGVHAVSFSAGGAGQITLSCRGRFA